VAPIRIVLIGMTRMLREIVYETLTSGRDVRIVNQYDEVDDLVAAIERDRPEFVIAGAETIPRQNVARALDAAPRLKILGLAADGRQLYLHELAPRRLEFGEISPQRLLTIIRARARGELAGLGKPPS
jgi:hypothetical protein